jgi:hypothetical protein
MGLRGPRVSNCRAAFRRAHGAELPRRSRAGANTRDGNGRFDSCPLHSASTGISTIPEQRHSLKCCTRSWGGSSPPLATHTAPRIAAVEPIRGAGRLAGATQEKATPLAEVPLALLHPGSGEPISWYRASAGESDRAGTEPGILVCLFYFKPEDMRLGLSCIPISRFL